MSARDPLQELEEALSFPMSPDFCARVRQRVAVEPLRPRTFVAWWAAAAATVALAAGIGVISTVRHQEESVAQGLALPVGSAGTLAPTASSGAEAPDLHLAHLPQRSAPVAARETVRPFETVVPDDQLRALDRLLAAMRQGRATVPPLVADVEVNDRGERVLRKVVIEPVTIELLAGTPADPNKNPVKDPNK